MGVNIEELLSSLCVISSSVHGPSRLLLLGLLQELLVASNGQLVLPDLALMEMDLVDLVLL